MHTDLKPESPALGSGYFSASIKSHLITPASSLPRYDYEEEFYTESHCQALAGEHLPRLSGRRVEMRIEGRGARPSASSTRASCFPRWPPPMMPTFRLWLPTREVGTASSVPFGLGKQRSCRQPSRSHVCPDHLQPCPPGRVPCHGPCSSHPAMVLSRATREAEAPRDILVLPGPAPDLW